MKKILSIIAIALLASCTPSEDATNCNCGTVTAVEPNPNRTQFKYTVKTDCNELYTYESRVEILTVGFRKCK